LVSLGFNDRKEKGFSAKPYLNGSWLTLDFTSGPGESHGRLACYASQGNGCSMGCALSTAARFEYAGSGFIPTSGGIAMHDKV